MKIALDCRFHTRSGGNEGWEQLERCFPLGGQRLQTPSSGSWTALWTRTRAMPQACRVLASQMTTR